jgi:hypothetical protein
VNKKHQNNEGKITFKSEKERKNTRNYERGRTSEKHRVKQGYRVS